MVLQVLLHGIVQGVTVDWWSRSSYSGRRDTPDPYTNTHDISQLCFINILYYDSPGSEGTGFNGYIWYADENGTIGILVG